MQSRPFRANPPNIQDAISASVSPLEVPMAKTIAIGAEAANRNAITALLRLTTEKSEITFLKPGKGRSIGSKCNSESKRYKLEMINLGNLMQ